MIKIHKCSYCGIKPHFMVCRGDDIETEYKLTHFCKNKKNYRDVCGNWYETKRLAVLDWNRYRAISRDGIVPRRDNFFLRQPDIYYPNGDLR